ncbi:predicted protein [Nematostella vectensis]|uniref:G-protein coupled receptors family 2 profile 2 domain-containing protein n=1 Tax=Nematostella vectensis TaxID=45351 RepID=A7SG55_NEMVE|nr:predicted protein [Nematostella vectensis]|eukprot:XP_001629399.1 predicted protein [Nematostella vectensis]
MTSFVGIPVLVVGISLAVVGGSPRGIQSYTQLKACWISYNHHVIWTVVVPAALVIVVSIYMGYLWYRVTWTVVVPAALVIVVSIYMGHLWYRVTWTVVVPAALVIVITISILSMRLIFQTNSSIFFRVLKELSNMSKRQKRAQDSYSIVRNLKACIVLFPVLGITWSIGFVNMLDAGVVTMYLFTILNSTQTDRHENDRLRPTDMRPTDMRLTDMRPTDMRLTDMRSTDIRPTDMRSTDMRTTDMRLTDMRPTDIRLTDMRLT